MSSKLNFYPSLKANMGSWDYYITRMRIGDVAREISFASEFGAQQDQVDTLGEARQRALSTSRVRKQIVSFLEKKDRFFSSLVVATMEGDPMFFPVTINSDNVGSVFANSKVDESFGVLRLDETRKIYALDGQHRLAAIKSMLDMNYRKAMRIRDDINVPENFENETLSVIMVIPKSAENPTAFLRNYRRLFASLNRHAKKTDKDTDIIIDEDDVYAILTRQLVSKHPMFQDTGKEGQSQRIKMTGRNLKDTDSHFTSLQTLYDMNKTLLLTRTRKSDGAWKNKEDDSRPPDEELESLYKELSNYWNAIESALPDLSKPPIEMRPASKGKNHMLFRPIGQEVLAKAVRMILDKKFASGKGSKDDMAKAIASSLSSIKSWNLLSHPWYGIMVERGKTEKDYTMRSAKRAQAIEWSTHFITNLAGVTSTSDDILFEAWESLITPQQADPTKYWDKHIAPLLKPSKK